MRRWGIVITVFYAFIVTLFLAPLVLATIPRVWEAAGGTHEVLARLLAPPMDWIGEPAWWLWVTILVGGQALLLFLSVDTSRRMLRPRQHVAVTAGTAALLTALLALAAIVSLAVALRGDDATQWPLFPGDRIVVPSIWKVLAWLGALWTLWGALFYLYCRQSSQLVSVAVSWLLKGSVLELLVAVPAHVWVQRRDDCSAPAVTGFGIATGIAVMLLSFGPGVLALYKKRVDQLRKRAAG